VAGRARGGGWVLGDEAFGHAGEQREFFAHLGWKQIRRRSFGVDQISEAGVVLYYPATMTHRDPQSRVEDVCPSSGLCGEGDGDAAEAEVDHGGEVVAVGVAVAAALMRRILASMPSRRLLDRPCSTAATMPSKWRRIWRAKLMKGRSRER
jgi:hypothetical protein